MRHKKPSWLTKATFALNILFAVLTLCAYGSWFINPSTYPLAGVISLLVPVFLVLNAVFFLLGLFFSKKHSIIALITLLAGSWHIAGLLAGSKSLFTAKEKNQETLRIMTYNVRSFHYKSADEWPKNRDGITRLTDSLKPDIICMQEYLHGGTWLPTFSHTYAYIPNKKRMSLAIYSNYPILNTGEVAYTQKSGGYTGFIYADVLRGSDTLRIVNIHLKSIGIDARDLNQIKQIENSTENAFKTSGKRLYNQLIDAYAIRGEQAQQAKAFIDKSPYPVLVCGDFNDTPTAYTYRVLTKNLDDAFTQAGIGFGTTHVRFASNNVPLRIDYILCSPSISVGKAQVVHKTYSDHFAVYADLHIK